MLLAPASERKQEQSSGSILVVAIVLAAPRSSICRKQSTSKRRSISLFQSALP